MKISRIWRVRGAISLCAMADSEFPSLRTETTMALTTRVLPNCPPFFLSSRARDSSARKRPRLGVSPPFLQPVGQQAVQPLAVEADDALPAVDDERREAARPVANRLEEALDG